MADLSLSISPEGAAALRLPVMMEEKPVYEIYLHTDFEPLADMLSPLCRQHAYKRACVVTDSHVAPLYLSSLLSSLEPLFTDVISFAFPAGEASKNLDTVQELYTVLIDAHFDRHDLLIAFGGGVVGDLCGFAAATYMRGVDFIQIPTTLLSDVDSSIGGKTGVDFLNCKNMVGAFYMPRLVYTNVSLLSTLAHEQLLSGMGEVLKHGLIQDEAYFHRISSMRDALLEADSEAMLYAVSVSCRIKAAVVASDPFEHGRRALLNFGHTVGHAVESLSSYSLPHGFGVSIGMAAAAYLSVKKGYLDSSKAAAIEEEIASFGLPVRLPGVLSASISPEQIVKKTLSDKKRSGKQIRFILLRDIGDAFVCEDVSEEEILSAARYILSDSEKAASEPVKELL